MPNTILKRWNGSAFEELYPKTTVGQISASGTPSSTTFLRGDGQWQIPATQSHSHGNISNAGGWNNSPITPTNADTIPLTRSGLISNSNLTIGTSTTTFLRNDGTWATPDPWLYAHLSSDSSKTSTGFTTDLELTNLEANSYYEIELIANHYKTSTDSTSLRLAFIVNNTTGTPTFAANILVSPYSNSSTAIAQNYFAISNSVITGSLVNIGANTTVTATNKSFTVKGILYTGTSSKTLSLQTASQILLTNGAVGLKERSVLKARKIN